MNPTDDGNVDALVGGFIIVLGIALLTKRFDNGIQQVAGTVAMKGGNGPRVAQTKLIEVPNLVHLRGVVHLVDGNENGFLGPAKRTRHLFVVGVDAGAAIDDQYDGVRLVGSGECLMGNGRLEVIIIAHLDAARVD